MLIDESTSPWLDLLLTLLVFFPVLVMLWAVTRMIDPDAGWVLPRLRAGDPRTRPTSAIFLCLVSRTILLVILILGLVRLLLRLLGALAP